MKELKINNEETHWFSKYTYALYFSVATMITVGYGDIHPVNSYEAMFITIAMFVSCGVFAYSFNLIGDLVREFNMMENAFKNEMILVNRFLGFFLFCLKMSVFFVLFSNIFKLEKKNISKDLNF